MKVTLIYVSYDETMHLVGQLILNGLVWKPNRKRESKRPWDVEPSVTICTINVYHLLIKIVLSCFILEIPLFPIYV